MTQAIQVTDLKYHRNGVCGIGFIAAKFTFKEDGKTYSAVATLFNSEAKEDRHYAILTAGDDGQIDISQTWRGDHFSDELYNFAKSDAGQHMMFPHLAKSA